MELEILNADHEKVRHIGLNFDFDDSSFEDFFEIYKKENIFGIDENQKFRLVFNNGMDSDNREWSYEFSGKEIRDALFSSIGQVYCNYSVGYTKTKWTTPLSELVDLSASVAFAWGSLLLDPTCDVEHKLAYNRMEPRIAKGVKKVMFGEADKTSADFYHSMLASYVWCILCDIEGKDTVIMTLNQGYSQAELKARIDRSEIEYFKYEGAIVSEALCTELCYDRNYKLNVA